MQEFIKLLGEANRSTEPWRSEGSLLYYGTEISFFALHLVLMDGPIADSLNAVFYSSAFAPFARGHEELLR